jgi:hypothetical protein
MVDEVDARWLPADLRHSTIRGVHDEERDAEAEIDNPAILTLRTLALRLISLSVDQPAYQAIPAEPADMHRCLSSMSMSAQYDANKCHPAPACVRLYSTGWRGICSYADKPVVSATPRHTAFQLRPS